VAYASPGVQGDVGHSGEGADYAQKSSLDSEHEDSGVTKGPWCNNMTNLLQNTVTTWLSSRQFIFT